MECAGEGRDLLLAAGYIWGPGEDLPAEGDGGGEEHLLAFFPCASGPHLAGLVAAPLLGVGPGLLQAGGPASASSEGAVAWLVGLWGGCLPLPLAGLGRGGRRTGRCVLGLCGAAVSWSALFGVGLVDVGGVAGLTWLVVAWCCVGLLQMCCGKRVRDSASGLHWWQGASCIWRARRACGL